MPAAASSSSSKTLLLVVALAAVAVVALIDSRLQLVESMVVGVSKRK
jgi:hypothetical protein